MQDTKWKRIRSNHLEYVLKKINKLLHALEFQRIKHQNFDFFRLDSILVGLPRWLSGKEFGCHCRRCRFNPCVGKIPWKGKWLPTPVFLPGKTHGERSLAGYTPQGFKESDTTEWTTTILLGSPEEPPPLTRSSPHSRMGCSRGTLMTDTPGAWGGLRVGSQKRKCISLSENTSRTPSLLNHLFEEQSFLTAQGTVKKGEEAG